MFPTSHSHSHVNIVRNLVSIAQVRGPIPKQQSTNLQIDHEFEHAYRLEVC